MAKIKDKVGLIYNGTVKEYPSRAPFNPPETYSELNRFNFNLDSENKIYEMVRNNLILLKLDEENLNTHNWNPFSDFIEKGDVVLIKPNFVKDFHSLGEKGILSQITHASILRPIIDYVLLALDGTGRIILADTPLDKADFKKIIKLNQTVDLLDFYKKQFDQKIELYDLRSYTLKKTRINYDKKSRIPLSGPPEGYIKIDLKEKSELNELDNDITDYFTLADSTIDKYNIRTNEKGKTNDYHHKGKHVYKIPKIILKANVIISVPKLKTHRMAGVTLNLKNIIGICEKIYLPHHRRGSPPIGDAFPEDPSTRNVIKRKAMHKYTIIFKQISNVVERIKKTRLLGMYFLPYYEKFLKNVVIEEDWWGAWSGNDTLWRTIYDLNKLLLYSTETGVLNHLPQRKYFSIIDGIIGQEGEGPMTGIPKSCGITIGGRNPISCDTIASYVMGFDINKLKILNNAKNIKKYNLGYYELKDIHIVSNLKNPLDLNLKFKLPKGYRKLSR